MWWSFFRLYSLVSSFWTRSNVHLLMKVLQMWTRRQTPVLSSQLMIPAAYIFTTCSGCRGCFSFISINSSTASSRSESSPSHSLSNQSLINLSSSCPRLDYTPFIRCSITLTATLLCHSSLSSDSRLCLEDKPEFLGSLWVYLQPPCRTSLSESLRRLWKCDPNLIFKSYCCSSHLFHCFLNNVDI